jgi:3-carboxy-cis,cis-muconate cycloisomerase
MPEFVDSLSNDTEIAAAFDERAELAAILSFERALAEASADAGLIPPAAVVAIGTAIASFTPDFAALNAGMATDGVVVPALLRQLRAAIGHEHAEALHFGATSQDAIDTGLILRLAGVIPKLLDRLAELERRLTVLGESDDDRPLMAHTRMQAALPFTVADKLATWIEPFGRHRQSLSAIRRRLLVIQLGGPVGDRRSFGGKGEEVARRLAAILDLGLAMPWHTERDALVEVGSLMALISGSLGKFGADVSLMSQSEIGSIKLAGGGGSSSMPHKSNPVKAEVLVALARYNAGLSGILQQAMVAENERSGAAWTLEWLTLPKLVITTGKSLALALELAGQISFN